MKIFTFLVLLSFPTLFFVTTQAQQTADKKSLIAAATLRTYEGRYEVNPLHYENFIVDVAAENDELLVQLSHRQKRRFVYLAPDKFTDSEIPKITLIFTRGNDGRVSGLTLNNIRMTYYTDDARNITSRMVLGEKTAEAKKIEIAPPSDSGNTKFKLKGFPNARIVALAGTFNNWNQTQNLCRKESDGWICLIDLAPGRHTYKFVVDGAWMLDPENDKSEDDGQGNFNSVLVVKETDKR